MVNIMVEKIKVLYIAGRVNTRNGAFHSLLSNVKEFKKSDVEPIVLIHKHGDTEEELKKAGVEYRIIPYEGCAVPADKPSRIKGMIKSAINMVQEKKIEKIIRDENIDVVHINVSTTSIGAKSALKLGKPLVWHAREFLEEDVNLTYINRHKTKTLLQNANMMIAISEAVAKHFRDEYQINRIVTVYNGINFESLLPVKEIEKNQSVIKIALVGRIVPTKGQLEALKALKIVREKGYNVCLSIVGDSGNENYYETIKKFIELNDLEQGVLLVPHKKDLRQVWKETDIALICSTKEGFGRVTAEFMLNGVPVIGANTGATPELLKENRGLLYEYGDENDLANKIMKAINERDLTLRMAQDAQKYAKEKFTAKYCAQQIESVYRQVLKE